MTTWAWAWRLAWRGLALTVADAATVMDADPGVRAGISTYDLHPVRGFPGSALA